MKKVKVSKGKFAVIKKGEKIITVKEAKKNLLIEGGDDVTVTSKAKSALTEDEKKKLK